MTRSYEYFESRSIWTRLDGVPFVAVHLALWLGVGSEPGSVLAALTHGFVFLAGEWWPGIRRFVRLWPCSAGRATVVLVRPANALKRPRFCAVQRKGGGRFLDFERKTLVFAECGSLERLKRGIADSPKPVSELWTSQVSEEPTDMDLPMPDFAEMLKSQVQEPLFVFQLGCVLLWLLDEYWHYALVTLGLLLFLEVQNAYRRISEMRDIRNLKPVPIMINVALSLVVNTALGTHEMNRHEWRLISSEFLIPGNIIKLDRSLLDTPLPVDVLLIGNSETVRVSEAMLTGEEVPVTKVSAEISAVPLCSLAGRRQAVVLAGTRLLEVPGEGVRGVVLSTGFDTTQGKLVRTILFSQERMTAAGSADVWRFLVSMFCCAVVAASYVLYEAVHDRPHPRSPFKIFLSVSHILTSVVPPEFPLILSITVTLTLLHLQRHGLHSTEPYRLLETPKIRTCCWDKTETLTCSVLTLRALVAVGEAELPLAKAVASVVINDGDPLEEAARDVRVSAEFQLVKKFPFDAELRRSTAVVRELATGRAFVFSKGALDHPDARRLAADGLRVLGLFCKPLPPDSPLTLSRAQAERDLVVVGVAGFSAELRPNVKRTIARLQSSGRRCVMITGDHLLTSLYVAREVGILHTSSPASDGEDGGVSCDAADWETQVVKAGGWQKVAVFARASPQMKEFIVKKLQTEGACLMVGDGTNDVGALKAAAVGVAVVGKQKNVDASIAAPFVAPEPECVSVLLRAGAACRASVQQSYRVLAVNSLVGAFCLSVLTLNGVKLGDFQTAVESLFVSTISLLASNPPPAKRLPPWSASDADASFFTASLMLNLLIQAAMHACLLYSGQRLLVGASGVQSDAGFLDTPFQASPGNSAAFLQLAAAHLSTYVANFQGPPALPRLAELRTLRNALIAGAATLLLAASQTFPPLNDLFGLVDVVRPDHLLLLIVAHLLAPLCLVSLFPK